jgi:S-DNA-T family DNA segregation ATPase FtsK/SpoIIIE
VTVLLPERNLLLGGEPGAGKSVALSLLVATAALDPSCRLWLLDGKLVELATWSRCAEGKAGVSSTEAIEVLHNLQEEMDHRYAQLLDAGRRKVAQNEGVALHVVVIDELAHYLTTSDRKERTEFADLLRDLVSRGRAAGIIVLAATQKPSADVVPTSIRDLFGFRWAMRCSTPQASDTILGSGWASAGYSAADVDPASRGVGYLLHEGGVPQRIRSYYLDDLALVSLSKRAEALRARPSMLEEA